MLSWSSPLLWSCRAGGVLGVNDISDNRWVYLKIDKGMYGLPQSGKLAHNILKKSLGEAGYSPVLKSIICWY